MRPSALSFTRTVAQLALLALFFQLSALGHWSFGPIHAEPGDVASHAAHCHGDISGCAGESSMTGSLVEVDLVPLPPVALLTAISLAVFPPSDAYQPAAFRPPRA